MNFSVLLVEDHPYNRQMLSRRLEKKGLRVQSLETGQAVLKLLESVRPDIILLDLSLPDIDGWTLATRLKSEPATRSIPIVAVTAHAMPGDREKALAAGCDAYIPKPIDFRLLLDSMGRLLASLPELS